jgi:hypothetical protein
MTLSHQYEGANAPDYEKADPSLKESVCLSTDKSGSLFCQTAMLQALRVVAHYAGHRIVIMFAVMTA